MVLFDFFEESQGAQEFSVAESESFCYISSFANGLA
jgi:hypothetical protein